MKGAIKESDSTFSSNIVLVRKKDGTLRFCLDFRMLNSRTRKDAYQLPTFEDQVDLLVGSRFYSKLNLRSGYWNIDMDEESKQYTGFPSLLDGHGTTKSKSKIKGKKSKSPGSWTWSVDQQSAFDTLKEKLSSPPALAFADFSKPFIVHIDACSTGLGAVLLQQQDDDSERVIAYVNRSLRPSERNYPAHKLEFMALKWATIAFQGVYDQFGHAGHEKSLWLARQRFYWPGMEVDFKRMINLCKSCVCGKTPQNSAAELVPIQTSRPMQLVCMDFLKLEKCISGYEDVLVITDHFTRYANAIPCRNQKATTTARALYEHFIIHYSFPEQLHSDQGRNFESKVIKEQANVRKTGTTPFHTMGNPSAERFNRTLNRMLRTLTDDHKTSWADYVLPLCQAYNATPELDSHPTS
ncbi:uncharacterized protein LOC132731091 [Ruditapes philippinarum]|uniref:uncharacterized protein LOC132731091 n=1 Tax=Ruditapes philippinarum TaxID=129788 RepID=UPI00295B41FB|nr:uncharacterized protein LOC132731091 [Ruditapes philippinarum]